MTLNSPLTLFLSCLGFVIALSPNNFISVEARYYLFAASWVGMWTSLAAIILLKLKDDSLKSLKSVPIKKLCDYKGTVLVLVAAISLLTLNFIPWSGNGTSQHDPLKVESQQETPSPIALMELSEDPNANNTIDRYIGLPITAEGTVERIHERKIQSDGVTISPYREIDVTVGLANDTFPQIVRISMDMRRWQKEIDSLDPGDSIKVRGTLFEIDRNFLRITQGEFIR